MDYLIEQGESELAAVSAHIGQDETSTRALLADLIEKGFVQEMVAGSKHRYRVRLAPWYICSRRMKEKDERNSPYCRVRMQRRNRQGLTGERV
jgi:DNA-binding IclR family transcriptional regulator